MNLPESRILSILRPGDLLRFVFRPARKGQVRFHLEGAAASDKDNALMSQRLSLVLGELRSIGYQFDDAGPVPGHEAEADGGESVWVALRPQVLSGGPVHMSRLGFGAAEPSPDSECSVCLPDFPPSDEAPVTDSLLGLIALVPDLECLELEFVRTELPPEAVKPLENALNLQMVAQGMVAHARPPLVQSFLASWLWHRSGWTLAVRARFPDGVDLPVASLEMIGRDLFRCECELLAEEGVAQGANAIDLGCKFPRGWQFPPLLPRPDAADVLAASRLLNASLPKLPVKGLKIGTAEGRAVRLPTESRDRHTYIVGGTGTGKSTLMARMIREDIKRGEGVILLDPHGDLYQTVLQSVPEARRDEVFRIDPEADMPLPGLNILDLPESRLRSRHAAYLVGELFRFFEENWDMRNAGGPTFEMYFRNTLLLMCQQDSKYSAAKEKQPSAERKAREALDKIMQAPGALPLSLKDFTRVMTDKDFRRELLQRCPDNSVVEFWTNVAEKTSGDYQLANFVPYITSKVNALVQTGFVSDLLCAPRNDLRIGERMNRGEIVLINLNKGLLGGYESRLLGTILMMEIFAAGLQRSMLPEQERRPVNIYVDEFQNFVSDNVASMLSEARKFGLRLTLANQTLTQLRASAGRQNLLETVLGNVGNVILFRLGVPDADRLQLFTEPYTRQQMQELPNYHALARLLTAEGPVRPLIMQTLKL